MERWKPYRWCGEKYSPILVGGCWNPHPFHHHPFRFSQGETILFWLGLATARQWMAWPPACREPPPAIPVPVPPPRDDGIRAMEPLGTARPLWTRLENQCPPKGCSIYSSSLKPHRISCFWGLLFLYTQMYLYILYHIMYCSFTCCAGFFFLVAGWVDGCGLW